MVELGGTEVRRTLNLEHGTLNRCIKVFTTSALP